MTMPSFQPWYARVRMVRLWFAIVAFIFVAAVSRMEGVQWDYALMRAVGGAVVAFFLGWASTLWLFSEIYQLQVKRAEDELRRREQERMDQLRDMTSGRRQQDPMAQPQPGQPGAQPMPPGASEAA